MLPEEHGRIYCMINSGGKPLTPTICDVLLFNAVDMYESRRRVQRIKGRNYDGVIESNLKVIETFAPIVQFEALLATDKWDTSPITFGVRVDDLDGIHLQKGAWNSVLASVIGLPPLHMLPPEIQRAIREGKGIPIDPKNIPPGLRKLIERKIREMMEDDDDGPEYDVGEPTYG